MGFLEPGESARALEDTGPDPFPDITAMLVMGGGRGRRGAATDRGPALFAEKAPLASG